jgi:methyl-accepting chemotaxis protein
MKDLKISQKITISFLVVIVLFLFVASYTLVQLSILNKLHGETEQRAHDSVAIEEAAGMSDALYSVFADAIINRELSVNKREWKEVKGEAIQDLENIGKIVDTPEEKQYLRDAESLMNQYFDVYDELLVLLENDNQALSSGIVALDARADDLKQEAHDVLLKILTSVEEEMHESVDVFNSKVKNVDYMILFIGSVVILLTIWLGITLVRLIARPLLKSVQFANAMAEGDLTAKMNIEQKDELGLLVNSLNNMSKRLQSVIGSVVTGADNIAAASNQLSSASQQVSSGVSEQAASTEEVSSSMEEMAASIQQNTDNASKTRDISSKASTAMEQVAVASDESMKAVRDIYSKINIVVEIAEKTDLLAINAAVEAARAGEQGRGFAVVAAEVRKLAERSQAAANDIVQLADKGLKLTEESTGMLKAIVPDIQETSRLVDEIAVSSQEQDAGASQVNSAIQQLTSVTQQNASSSEEMAGSSEELASQASELKDIVGYFRLEEAGRMSQGRFSANRNAGRRKDVEKW